MVEAIVGVALRAILASVLLGGLLAGLVLLATRGLALTAGTRHALWTTALIATAVMPLAGIVVSVSRAAAVPAAVPPVAEAWIAHSAQVNLPPITTPGGGASVVASRPTTGSVASLDRGPHATRGGRAAWGGAPFNQAPRVPRALALGVVGVWLVGVLIGLIGLGASIARVRGLKRRSSPLDGALADELPWLTEVDGGREIYLRLSFETETPVAIGFRRPVILIPTELATADGLAAIEPLVLHEHAHLRRYDDWTNLVQRTIERIFWFNPVVWLVGRKIALEREIASDDAVVERTGEPHAYATSLWKLAREMRMPEHAVVAPGALLTRKQITIRIEQLLDKKRSRLHGSPAAALGVGLAGMLAVAFVATSAPAVELPVQPIAAMTAAPAADTHHANLAKPPTATTAQAPAHDLSGALPAVHEQRIIRIVETVQRPPGPIATWAPPVSPAAKAPAKQPLAGARPQEIAALGPADAAVPPLPPLPAVPSFSPETLHKLRAATAAAARSHLRDAETIGPDVARVLHDVLSSLPREIAQEAGTPGRRLARLDGVKLTREVIASCTGCSFRHADARGLDLHGLKFTANDFSGADMRGANLAGAQLFGVSLAGANLANADLRAAQLSGVELRRANFEGAQLDGIKLFGISVRHLSLRGTLLRNIMASCTGCDFASLDLHGQDLHGISLSGADLSYADLRDANLNGARFNGVNFAHAKLTGADLSNARLDGCDLSGVDLRGARTTGMTMQGSGFDG